MTQSNGTSSCRYALVMVDDATSYVHVHPLKNKGQAFEALTDFVAFAETQTTSCALLGQRLSVRQPQCQSLAGSQGHPVGTKRAIRQQTEWHGERMPAALIGRHVSYSLWPEAIEFAATCLNLVLTIAGPHAIE